MLQRSDRFSVRRVLPGRPGVVGLRDTHRDVVEYLRPIHLCYIVCLFVCLFVCVLCVCCCLCVCVVVFWFAKHSAPTTPNPCPLHKPGLGIPTSSTLCQLPVYWITSAVDPPRRHTYIICYVILHYSKQLDNLNIQYNII